MQEQSSPLQVKDPYTGSILMRVGSSANTLECTMYTPKNIQKLIDGSIKQENKQKH